MRDSSCSCPPLSLTSPHPLPLPSSPVGSCEQGGGGKGGKERGQGRGGKAPDTLCAGLAHFVVPIRGLILVVVESSRESPRQRWVGRRSARGKKEKRAKTNHDFRRASLS